MGVRIRPHVGYSENPGWPSEEERGTYCPDGVKIAEFPQGRPREQTVVEPWPCMKPWCTPEAFHQALAAMEADLAESEKHARGCVLGPSHAEPCESDRGNPSH